MIGLQVTAHAAPDIVAVHVFLSRLSFFPFPPSLGLFESA